MPMMIPSGLQTRQCSILSEVLTLILIQNGQGSGQLDTILQ